MSLKDKLKNIFQEEEDFDEIDGFEDIPVSKKMPKNEYESSKPTRSSLALDALSKMGGQMILLEPREYAESQAIGDHLLNHKAVILNLHKLPKEQAKRILDFLAGVSFAIDGNIEKVGQNIFLCTPSNYGVYGEISDTDM